MIATLAPAKPKPLTAEDLMKMDSEGVRGELVQGAFYEIMGSGFRHTVIAGRFARHLGNFVEPRGLGLVGGADGGVRLERDPDTVRIPDAMFIPANRLPPYDDLDLYFESIPAIAVEVKFPSRISAFSARSDAPSLGERIATTSSGMAWAYRVLRTPRGLLR